MNRPQGIIVLTGPESTGKSTLADYLSTQLRLPLLSDVSRAYVASLQQRTYTEQDVLEIARLIVAQEQEMLRHTPLFISDNCLINIMIWLRYYQWQVPDWLKAKAEMSAHKHYLLCATDLPWVPDEQRQNKHDRHQLMELFTSQLRQHQLTYSVVSGIGDMRIQMAMNAVKSWFPTRF